MALTIDADDWARPLNQWKPPAPVGTNGFTAIGTIPPPPAAPGYFYDDMLLSDDGSRAVLLAFPGAFPTRLLLWDGSLWRDLEPPSPVLFTQWPGAWAGGQGSLTAPGEIAVNSQGLFVYASGQLGWPNFVEYSGGAWAARTGYSALHFQFRAARDAERAVVGEIQGACAVWTGANWSFADNNSATALEYERTIGISADGNLAVCAGDNDGGVVFRDGPHAPPKASVWNGNAWQTQELGGASCLVRDVAVAQNGAMAVVALTCDVAAGTAPATALPQVELAVYRNGAWSLTAVADTQVVPGIGSSADRASGVLVYTLGAASAGPRVAVSADGTVAVAVWGEPSGAYAAYYR